MQAFNNFLIKLFNKKIGEDEFSNQYFQSKSGKRFVIYNGIAEASKIPSEWRGWMHYTTNITPISANIHKFSWQKIHLPNLTGTKNSYSPLNSSVKKTNADFNIWKAPL